MLRNNMFDLDSQVIVLIVVLVVGQMFCSPTKKPITVTTTLPSITVDQSSNENKQLSTFFTNMEQLIMNTTDQALNATQNVYREWLKVLPDELCHTACPLMRDYIEAVDHARTEKESYAEKRKLFIRFRETNEKIDLLYDQLSPEAKRFNYQLLSEEFYNNGRNTTSFDNLYLNFIQQFEAASQSFWNNMSEGIVEDQQELLDILDDISSERELKEKDKLYDEFIDLYLFKTEENKRR